MEPTTSAQQVKRQGSKKIACVPARALFDPRITPAVLRVLAALGLYTNPKGRCHVRNKTLATVLGIDIRLVRRYLKALEEFGYLTRTTQFYPDGRQREDIFHVLFEEEGGGIYAPSPRGRVCPPHEPVVEPVTTSGPGRAGPSEVTVEIIDLREEEGPSATLSETPTAKKKSRPTKPKAPSKENPVSLGKWFVDLARVHQWGHPSPATVKELAGTFRRWRDEHGVTYREIRTAINLFFDQLPKDLEAPAGRLFIKQGFDWISAAKDDIYAEELPKLQKAHYRMQDLIYEEHEAACAAHPEWDEDERRADRLARYWYYRKQPEFAPCFAK